MTGGRPGFQPNRERRSDGVKQKSVFPPLIRAYSLSLMGFIRFLRDRFPLVNANGGISPLEDLEELPHR